jgi:hypothetical protein
MPRCLQVLLDPGSMQCCKVHSAEALPEGSTSAPAPRFAHCALSIAGVERPGQCVMFVLGGACEAQDSNDLWEWYP